MKFKKLCAVALIAAVAAGTVGPSVASASTNIKASTGNLEVTAGGFDPDENLVDPEKPGITPIDPTTPGVDPNEDMTGQSKGITGVTTLDFDSIEVGTTTAYASPITLKDNTASNPSTRGNMVFFGDVSGTPTGYTITGALTSQFNNNTTTLTGSSITFSNGILVSDGAATISGQSMDQVLDESGAKTFVSAANTEGAGWWTMEFGQSAEYVPATGKPTGNPGTDGNSILLTIPNAVAGSMTTGDYVATVTWTMGPTA